MKTLDAYSLQRAFPPTLATVGINLKKNDGWITNGFFIIRAALEPKISQRVRFIETDAKYSEIVEKWEKELPKYEVATVVNDIRVCFDKTFLVKLKSASYEVWCNPKLLSYVLNGTGDRKLEIKIGEAFTKPILLMRDDQVLGGVMPFRNPDQD